MTNGERIRAARVALGMTQVELAAKSGITQGAVSAIERDDTEFPTHDTVVRLARALVVAPEELFPVPDPTTSEAA